MPATAATMPKTSVDKHSHLFFREEEIRSAEDFFRLQHPAANSGANEREAKGLLC